MEKRTFDNLSVDIQNKEYIIGANITGDAPFEKMSDFVIEITSIINETESPDELLSYFIESTTIMKRFERETYIQNELEIKAEFANVPSCVVVSTSEEDSSSDDFNWGELIADDASDDELTSYLYENYDFADDYAALCLIRYLDLSESEFNTISNSGEEYIYNGVSYFVIGDDDDCDLMEKGVEAIVNEAKRLIPEHLWDYFDEDAYKDYIRANFSLKEIIEKVATILHEEELDGTDYIICKY